MRTVMYLDLQNAGGISPVADDRAQHKGGANGDQLKLVLPAGIPCFSLCRHLHHRQLTMPPAGWDAGIERPADMYATQPCTGA